MFIPPPFLLVPPPNRPNKKKVTLNMVAQKYDSHSSPARSRGGNGGGRSGGGRSGGRSGGASISKKFKGRPRIGAVSHVAVGGVVKFDPAARREYVTGFAKRKAQRRKDATIALAKKAQAEKLQARKSVREERASKLREVGFQFEEQDQAREEARGRMASTRELPGASQATYGEVAVVTEPMTLADEPGATGGSAPRPKSLRGDMPAPTITKQPRRSEKALLRAGQKILAKGKKTGPARSKKSSGASGGKTKRRNLKR